VASTRGDSYVQSRTRHSMMMNLALQCLDLEKDGE